MDIYRRNGNPVRKGPTDAMYRAAAVILALLILAGLVLYGVIRLTTGIPGLHPVKNDAASGWSSFQEEAPEAREITNEFDSFAVNE